MNQPPLLPPRLAPVPPKLPALKPRARDIEAVCEGYDKVRVSIDGLDKYLTRHEAFRLIGELERAAGES